MRCNPCGEKRVIQLGMPGCNSCRRPFGRREFFGPNPKGQPRSAGADFEGGLPLWLVVPVPACNSVQCTTAGMANMATPATKNLQLAGFIDPSSVRIPLSPPCLLFSITYIILHKVNTRFHPSLLRTSQFSSPNMSCRSRRREILPIALSQQSSSEVAS